MSCNEWEKGSIKIPSNEWAGLKAAVRKQYNQKQEMGLAMSIALYHHIKEALKGKRNQDRLLDAAAEQAYEQGFMVTNAAKDDKTFEPEKLGGGRYNFRIIPGKYEEQYDFWWDVRNSVLTKKDGKLALKKPLKKDWPLATNKTKVFDLGEASITFSEDSKKTVNWYVPDNNHAVDRARAYSIAQAFFSALRRITWTRGSGGTIVGNNEYNREDNDAGGGANYVVNEFGPKTAKEERNSSTKGIGAGRSLQAFRNHYRW